MAETINKLTVAQIRAAGSGKLEDGAGLRLRKNKTGTGLWIFRYSFAGRRREMALGSYPDVSLADARRARGKWAAVLQSGLDPISDRARARAEEVEQMTRRDPLFRDLAADVFEARKELLRGDGVRGRWFSPLRLHVIPRIGHKRISQITQSDLRDALAPIWRAKHETADKAITRTRIIFEQARLMGYEADPFTVDAARHMLGHVDHKVRPIASTPWQDVPDLFGRLNKAAPSYLALRWTILTATRGDGARGARFSEIDGSTWTIPEERMKGRRGQVSEFRVPLSTAAIDVLEVCRQHAHNDFLFPSPCRGCVSVQALTKVLKFLNEPGRPHGFRTSFRTWVQDTNAGSYDVAETALAHIVGNKVERSYARSDLLDQRRILMQKWADYVTKTSASVVHLRG